MAYGKRSTWDTIREVAYDSLDSAFSDVGGITTKAVRVVKFTNATDVTIYFTDDETNDKLKLPANSFSLWDITTNKALADKPQFCEVGTQFSARHIAQLAPSSGWVSVEILIVESGS